MANCCPPHAYRADCRKSDQTSDAKRNVQDRDDFGGVLRRWTDEDIKVAGEARARMKGETIRSDDQVLNAVGV